MASVKKILLAEDEQDLADIFILKLQAAGYKVCHAITGVEALKMVKQEKPDLILLDLVMPEMDGYETLKQLKGGSGFGKVPIYVWSNLTQKSELEKAHKMGADGYLIKSDLTPAQLVEKVAEIFNKKDSKIQK